MEYLCIFKKWASHDNRDISANTLDINIVDAYENNIQVTGESGSESTMF